MRGAPQSRPYRTFADENISSRTVVPAVEPPLGRIVAGRLASIFHVAEVVGGA
jgi:hypothetical protein